MNNHNILAIDLAKDVFQVCKTNSQGKVLLNREYSRQKLQELLITEKESLVAMESCCSAHYWSRFAMKYGHQVKMMDARSVKAFQTKQKTDRNDALAIAIAATQTHIHSIKVHTIDEQTMQSLERSRRLALDQQVAQSNHIRSILSEFGVTVPQGVNSLRARLPYLLEDAENGLPFSIRRSLKTLWEHLLIQLSHVEELDEQLQGMIKTHPTCQKLIKLEGVGPLGALGLALKLGRGKNFSCGRDASANIGLTPKQHSSGGKERIGHISKRNADKRLRTILYQGALSVIYHVMKRPAKTNKELWLQSLVERRGKKVAAIALANKNVRTANAILKNDSEYQPLVLA